MFTRFLKWLRVVKLPTPMLLLVPAFLFVVVLLEWTLQLSAVWLFGGTLFSHSFLLPAKPAAHQGMIVFMVLAYGIYRGSLFHPVANKTYGTWLAQTPWKYPEPLPYGPVQLVWQDAALVALSTALAAIPPVYPEVLWYLPSIFLVGYSGSLIYIFGRMQFLGFAALWLVLGAIWILVVTNPWWCFLVAAAMYAVVYLGIRSSLRAFPFAEADRERLGLVPYERPAKVDVGLPVAPVHPDDLRFRLRTPHILVLSGLLGLYGFAIGFHFHNAQNSDGGAGAFVMSYAFGIIFLGRMFLYLSVQRAPISLFGRFATGRWIIPEFDKVFLAPLVALAVGTALLLLLDRFALAGFVAWPLTIAVFAALMFSLPPRFEDWYYAGHFRIAAPRRIGQKFVQT
jgi:hypothetical protein